MVSYEPQKLCHFTDEDIADLRPQGEREREVFLKTLKGRNTQRYGVVDARDRTLRLSREGAA